MINENKFDRIRLVLMDVNAYDIKFLIAPKNVGYNMLKCFYQITVLVQLHFITAETRCLSICNTNDNNVVKIILISNMIFNSDVYSDIQR